MRGRLIMPLRKTWHDLLEITNVLLLSGDAQYDEMYSLTPQNNPRFVLKDFIPGLPKVFGAADVVVSRAGATALLELAAMALPTIVVPSKRLIWQIEHVKLYAYQNAVVSLDEDVFEDINDRSLVDGSRKCSTMHRTVNNFLTICTRWHDHMRRMIWPRLLSRRYAEMADDKYAEALG